MPALFLGYPDSLSDIAITDDHYRRIEGLLLGQPHNIEGKKCINSLLTTFLGELEGKRRRVFPGAAL